MANRLADESSPYLLQHRDNPVDWYPWGEEAFSRAKAEDKPVFVSIGYAACHWCHVMERECFEDEAIAALMNRHFVNVKVDREERPDVDAVYMNAIQLTGQGGGWPLSAFCTPDGEPFFLGTYFPPDDRHGRPGLPRVLESIARGYAEQRDELLEGAERILAGLKEQDARRSRAPGSVDDLRSEVLSGVGVWLAERSDPDNGGFGDAPKFPSSSVHALLARAGRLPGGAPAREAFLRQATAMARGGIHDHVGGGFARYSVDRIWLVPHFEKMLYDNAQLLGIYADAHALGGDAESREAIDGIVAWLAREMQHASGGLYASQDADSEGEEGRFYVWTPQQIHAVLEPVDAETFMKAYGVTRRGNFEGGSSVLSRKAARGDDASEAALRASLERLFDARKERVAPETDTKVLASWNGLALTGLVRAWEATGSEPALSMARAVARFLIDEMIEEEGRRIHRVWKDGTAKLDGTLDDYAFVAEGLMVFAEATTDARAWRLACALLDSIVERFYEETEGQAVFYMTPADDGALLVHRPISVTDSALPAGSSVAIACLLRRGISEADEGALGLAERYLTGHIRNAVKMPFSAGCLLGAMDLLLHGASVVVSEGEGRDALLDAARRSYLPAVIPVGSWSDAPGIAPGPDGHARALVCRGQTCSLPVSTPDALLALLETGGATP